MMGMGGSINSCNKTGGALLAIRQIINHKPSKFFGQYFLEPVKAKAQKVVTFSLTSKS
jgi:hypothetical protein